MQRLKIKVNNKKVFMIVTGVFASYFISNILFVILSYLVMEPASRQIVTNFLSGTFYAINVVLSQNNASAYMMITYLIYSRLLLVRKFLESVCINQRMAEKETVKNIRKVCVFVDKIGDTLDWMKISYTIMLIGYIAHFTFYSVLSIYGFLSYGYNIDRSYLDLVFSSITMLWNIYYAPFFIWIFIFSNRIEQEAKLIEMSAHRISDKRRSMKITRIVNLISMQFYHRRLTIECGVYVIDYKLLFLLISSIFSYLLIIIQFEFKNN